MGFVPKPEEALDIIKKYNKEAFHISHAITVGEVLSKIALKEDPGREEYWKTVGILHDIDFEMYPDEHCKKAVSLLKDEGIDEDIIKSVTSHGYGICSDVEPTHIMEKYLFAIDELTGLIGAAALMRPTGFEGMEVKSVVKKFKDKKFAAGCSRDIISRGADMLGLSLQELIQITLDAMK